MKGRKTRSGFIGIVSLSRRIFRVLQTFGLASMTECLSVFLLIIHIPEKDVPLRPSAITWLSLSHVIEEPFKFSTCWFFFLDKRTVVREEEPQRSSLNSKVGGTMENVWIDFPALQKLIQEGSFVFPDASFSSPSGALPLGCF